MKTDNQELPAERWQVPLQEDDWGKWWYAHVAHAATGNIAAAGMLIAPFELHPLAIVPFAGLTLHVAWRQYVEFLRRNDTPGRDLQWHLIGYVSGLAEGVGWLGVRLAGLI